MQGWADRDGGSGAPVTGGSRSVGRALRGDPCRGLPGTGGKSAPCLAPGQQRRLCRIPVERRMMKKQKTKANSFDEVRVYLVGGGIASLAAAAFLIRDANVLGRNIIILE